MNTIYFYPSGYFCGGYEISLNLRVVLQIKTLVLLVKKWRMNVFGYKLRQIVFYWPTNQDRCFALAYKSRQLFFIGKQIKTNGFFGPTNQDKCFFPQQIKTYWYIFNWPTKQAKKFFSQQFKTNVIYWPTNQG